MTRKDLWADEQIEWLRERVTIEGKSNNTKVITHDFNTRFNTEKTVNAIIGKLCRLGINLTGRASPNRHRPRSIVPLRRAEKPVFYPRPETTELLKPLLRAPSPVQHPELTCSWPVEPACSSPAVGAYCATHAQIAYSRQPTSRRTALLGHSLEANRRLSKLDDAPRMLEETAVQSEGEEDDNSIGHEPDSASSG